MMPETHALQTTTVVGVAIGSEYRATLLDNPNLSLQDAGVWESTFGGTASTDAGISVNTSTAVTFSAFWSAVQLIAGDVGGMPLAPYRVSYDEKGREIATKARDHWAYSLVAKRPNDHETAQDYWETLMTHALIWGNGYGYILRDRSYRPSELLHLLPDRTAPERVDGELIYVTEADGRLIPLRPWDVLHVKGLVVDSDKSPDFVSLARQTIGAGLAANKFAAKFFANGGRMGGVLELPAGMTKTARDTVEEGFKKSYGTTDAAFKTVILRDNAKFHSAQVSPRETQMVEASEAKAREIARWFGIPPSKLGIEGTSSYNSKAEDGAGYLTHCLRRWLEKIAAQCWLRLLTPADQRVIEFRHDTNEILRMDLLSRATAYQSGITNRWLSPNDVRAMESLPPYEGGDEYSNPNTASDAAASASDSPGETEDTAGDTTEDTAEEDTTTTADTTDSASRATEVTRRRSLYQLTGVARHKAKNPRALLEWLDGGFRHERETWTATTGATEPPVFFAALGERLQQVVSTTGQDQLAQVVDATCAHLEQEHG